MMFSCINTAIEMQTIFREIFGAARALNVGERWRRDVGIESIPIDEETF